MDTERQKKVRHLNEKSKFNKNPMNNLKALITSADMIVLLCIITVNQIITHAFTWASGLVRQLPVSHGR